jgi:hypothetical protein
LDDVTVGWRLFVTPEPQARARAVAESNHA